MSGRRLLDAAAIYKASRGVLSKYVKLQRHQWENYSRTSSLAKAVKSQTDRVTLTVKAASALSERFNSTGPTYTTQAPPGSNSDSQYSIPSQESVRGVKQTVGKRQGLEQDHFYQRSEGNSTAEPPPESELRAKQERAKKHPLPDGSIPPVDADTNLPQGRDVFSNVSRAEPLKSPLSRDEASNDGILEPVPSGRTSIPDPIKEVEQSRADRVRKLQRQAEKQIPSKSAETPPALPSNSRSETQGGDVFYTPSPTTSQSLSSLPRVKLPKVTEDRQELGKPVYDGQTNPDLFYSAVGKDQEDAVPTAQAVPEQERLPEDMYSEIFQSPRVARMLGAKPKSDETEKRSGLHVRQAAATEQTKPLQHQDQDSFSERLTGQADSPSKARHEISEDVETPKTANDEEIHQLATDMAKDSKSGASIATAVCL